MPDRQFYTGLTATTLLALILLFGPESGLCFDRQLDLFTDPCCDIYYSNRRDVRHREASRCQ